jgi:hypothetical protein
MDHVLEGCQTDGRGSGRWGEERNPAGGGDYAAAVIPDQPTATAGEMRTCADSSTTSVSNKRF